MEIKFVGAAKIVTGSCYWIKVGRKQILVDCGMFQGRKEITALNYKPFPFDPKKIDYVLLTHAHIDHSGLLPKLVKEGFRGKIYATRATVDLCKIMLEDSAHVQEMENEHENKRRKRLGEPARQPLYSMKDARDTNPFYKKVDYDRDYKIDKTLQVVYRDAGHIIGSAIIELYVFEGSKETKIVFSGDLGQWNVPIVKDPTIIEDADIVFVESTYGNRLHEEVTRRDEILLEHAKKVYDKGGILMIPSFAIERTQEILYSFKKLIESGKFPDEKIYLNSPLAIKATEVFKKHRETYDKEAQKIKDPFSFPHLVYVRTTAESIKLNTLQGPAIIIAGSGMCTGGRIRHHLKNGLYKPENTVLFVGYQAEGTLGRVILEGAKQVKMMGTKVAVKADIEKINSFSAHADYQDIIKWMKGFIKPPSKVFIVHGEETAANALKQKLETLKLKCHIPHLGEEVSV